VNLSMINVISVSSLQFQAERLIFLGLYLENVREVELLEDVLKHKVKGILFCYIIELICIKIV
jgi:hypothetical protein